MRFEQKQSEIQAIIFASGDPVELSRIAAAVELPPGAVAQAVEQINSAYRACGMPFEIVRLADAVQFCTLPPYAPIIRAALALKRNIPLSQAGLEALAVVAYNQPVTKAFVEQVRGVDSSGVMNSLAEKGLIEEAGRLELPGRPIAYRTSAHFLRCFALSSLDGLPPVEPSSTPEGPGEPDGGDADTMEGMSGEE